MDTNSYTVAQLQDLLEAEQKKYQQAIETDRDFEKAKMIFLKIKEYKEALNVLKNLNPKTSQSS